MQVEISWDFAYRGLLRAGKKVARESIWNVENEGNHGDYIGSISWRPYGHVVSCDLRFASGTVVRTRFVNASLNQARQSNWRRCIFRVGTFRFCASAFRFLVFTGESNFFAFVFFKGNRTMLQCGQLLFHTFQSFLIKYSSYNWMAVEVPWNFITFSKRLLCKTNEFA